MKRLKLHHAVQDHMFVGGVRVGDGRLEAGGRRQEVVDGRRAGGGGES